MKQALLISTIIILNGLNAQDVILDFESEDDAMIVLEFNSEDDAIIVENDQLPSGSNPRTLEAWVYPENSEGDPNVAYYGGGNGVGKHFGIRATTSTVYAFLGGAQRGITNLSLVGWHHVAFVLPENEDRTNKIKVFLDGVQMAIDHTVGDNYTINTGGSALEIGGSGFTGQIKQIRLWSAELSEEEISANKYIAYISSDDDNYDKLVYQLQEEEATFRIFGTAGNDFLEGSGEKDFIYGLDGDDEIHGGEGHDRMYGGTGDDVFYSGFGKDVIWGGDGYDTVHFPGKKKNYIKNQHSDHWVIKKGDGSKKTRIYDCELAVFKNGKTKSLE